MYMKSKKKLRNYKISVEGEAEGVDFISLVKSPAIMVQWVAFGEAEGARLKFQQDPKKRMLSGPFLIPDMPIYRYTEEFGEFTVTFDTETIEGIVKKFFRGQNVLNINEEHSDKMAPAYVVESWIVGGESDKSAELGFSLPAGTWFGTVYIESQQYWDEMIESGQVLGFSVEGLMGLAMSQINKVNMEKFENKNTFVAEDGTVFVTKGDEATLKVGDELMSVAEDGTMEKAQPGEHKMKDGTVVKVDEAGVITEVAAAEEEATEEVEAAEEVVVEPAAAEAVSEEAIRAAVAPLMEEMKAEVAAAMTELSNRIAAIEGTSADAAKEVADVKAAAEEMKKKFSEIPGGRFNTTPADVSASRTKYTNKFADELVKIKELKKTMKS